MKRIIGNYLKLPDKRTIQVYAAVFAVMLTGFCMLYITLGRSLTAFVSDKESFKIWLDGYKGLGAVIFVIIRAFQTVIKIIPAEPLEIASGYIFGTWGGLALCSLGSLIGTLIIIMLSRWLGVKFVHTFVNEEKLNELSIIKDRKNQRLFLAIFYLIPSTPKDFMTYAAGSLNINIGEFLIISTLARIPSIITSTICGSQISKHNITAAALVFTGTAIVSVICGIIYKRYKKSHS